MKIALIGYGKMGKEIESYAIEKGHEIVLTRSSKTPFLAEDLTRNQVDVAIEFTEPNSAVKNILKCFEAHVPVVVGTTGWYNRLPEIRNLCQTGNHSLFYASNFSIGVNIFFELNKHLAKIMNGFSDYEPSMKEIHHLEKKDAPSGTALTLMDDLLFELKEKSAWKDSVHVDSQEIALVSERLKGVPGTHLIEYNSDEDVIKIEHEAKGRKGFALGAIAAAEWTHKKSGVFTMKDMLNLND